MIHVPWLRPIHTMIALVVVLIGLEPGCAPPPRPPRPVVLVSVPPQAWFVEAIAGELVDVVVLVPPGASPATHEPGVATMRAISTASLWFKVGHPSFPFEAAWLEHLLAENENLTVVDYASRAELRAGDDPHLWLSPAVAAEATRELTEALAQLLPEQTAILRAHSDTLLERIDEVDQAVQRQLAPHLGRSFLVFHPAWGWFANHVGLHQIAIEHDHKLPSLKHLAESVDHAREANCRVVFVQPQFSDAAARQVAEALDADVVIIDPLAADWDTNLLRAATALAAGFSTS
jgi:zinc transport system substrate-binding protein